MSGIRSTPPTDAGRVEPISSPSVSLMASRDYLTWDDDLSEALATRESFFFYAPLGHRGFVRTEIRWLAAEQGRSVSVSAGWGDGEEINGADYFYVIPGPVRRA